MNNKGHSVEVSDRNEEKAIFVIMWIRTKLCSCPSALWKVEFLNNEKKIFG